MLVHDLIDTRAALLLPHGLLHHSMSCMMLNQDVISVLVVNLLKQMSSSC